MTEAEARRLAAAEGLSLVPAATATGYRGVYKINSRSKPFSAKVSHDGKQHSLGYYTTAAEAALEFLAGR